jgi:hypothetical protein
MALTQVNPGLLDSNAQYTGFKNRIINGAMVIDQRNAGASVNTSTPNSAIYTLDRWFYAVSQTSKFTVQQNAGNLTGTNLPSGFANYLGITSSSAYSLLTNDSFNIRQAIEGFNTSDLNWGTANAQPITLSFWVRSSLTGTFGGAIFNSAINRFYVFSYTISSANTWEKKSVTIAGDTSGTWVGATNGIGLYLSFSIGDGPTNTSTAGSWGSTLYLAPTGQVNVTGTNTATFYITGVQLEKGSTATSFDYRPYGTELALCQRYYETKDYQGSASRVAVVYAASTSPVLYQEFAVTKRATPTSITWSLNGSGRYVSTVGIGSSQTFSTAVASVSGCTVGSSGTFASSVGWLDNAGTMQINAEL